MIVWVPPDSLVDVDVLNEKGYQQVDEEQEFKEKAPIQRQLRDAAVTDRLWSDQRCDGRRREADGTTIPEETHSTHLVNILHHLCHSAGQRVLEVVNLGLSIAREEVAAVLHSYFWHKTGDELYLSSAKASIQHFLQAAD